jgi:protein TonB
MKGNKRNTYYIKSNWSKSSTMELSSSFVVFTINLSFKNTVSMETKKTPKADLENKKSTWLLIGYVMALCTMFTAFEWSQKDVTIDTSRSVVGPIFEPEIPITVIEEKVIPPPPPEPVKIVQTIEIVKDETEVAASNILSSEDTGEGVDIKYTPMVVEEPPVIEDEIFVSVEKMPEFPNGMGALLQYLGKNIKYPTIAQENNVQGRVTVQFVVNKDGSIVDVVVVKGIDPYLDKEALRVVSGMPKWKPGEQRGKPVRVKYTVPVTFRLQ